MIFWVDTNHVLDYLCKVWLRFVLFCSRFWSIFGPFFFFLFVFVGYLLVLLLPLFFFVILSVCLSSCLHQIGRCAGHWCSGAACLLLSCATVSLSCSARCTFCPVVLACLHTGHLWFRERPSRSCAPLPGSTKCTSTAGRRCRPPLSLFQFSCRV